MPRSPVYYSPLRLWRIGLGRSMNDVAYRCGCTYTAVLQWELGIRRPAKHLISALADSLELKQGALNKLLDETGKWRSGIS